MTESKARSHASYRLRLAVKLGAGVILLTAGIYLACSVTLHSFFGREFVERELNRSLPETMKGQYQIDVEAVQWYLWRCSVQIGPIILSPTATDSTRALEAGSRYTASLSQIQLRGLGVWSFLREGTVNVDKVVVDRPSLRKIVGDATPTDASEEETDLRKRIRTAVMGRLPPLRIGQLRIQNGQLTTVTERGEAAGPVVTDSLWGLSLRLNGIRTDSSAVQETNRLLFSESIWGSIDGYRRVSADSLRSLTVGAASVSTVDSSLHVKGIELSPTVSDLELMQRVGHRINRLLVSTGTAQIRGFNFTRFLDDQSILARTVVLDSLYVDVYRDNNFRPPPTDPPPKMPHELVQGLRQNLRIDSIQIHQGFVRYSKWKPEAATPGHISFQEINATVRNVTNDANHMSASTPAVIDASAYVAGEGKLNVTIRVPLLASHLSLSYEGRLGAMDARVFNDAFVPLSGVRIESGQVDSLWFSASVDQGRARGTVHGIYRDLDLEMLDKETGERGLGKRIATFVLNDLLLKSNTSKRDSTSLRMGTIEHEQEKQDTFFKFLWHSLRSGLYSLVGM